MRWFRKPVGAQAPRRFVRSYDRTPRRMTGRISPIAYYLMTYVYFLKLANADIYKGSTNNIDRRVKEHNDGLVESTKNYRPVILIGYEAYLHKSDALRREAFLKTTEGRRLLRQQYRDAVNSGEDPRAEEWPSG